MEAIVPYLNFNGNATEALDLYKDAFGGEVVSVQTYGQSPMDTPAGWEDKIMHAVFIAKELTLMVSDVSDENKLISGTNISLSLNFKQEPDIDRVFAALSEGANITMDLQKTFWGAKFGMLTDKFGINWMFNHDYADVKN